MAFSRPFSSIFELVNQIGFLNIVTSPDQFGGFRRDDIDVTGSVRFLNSFSGNDNVTIASFGFSVNLGIGHDMLTADGPVVLLDAGRGNDTITLNDFGGLIELGAGRDRFEASAFVLDLDTGDGRDTVMLESAGSVSLGRGPDSLIATNHVEEIDAGRGRDTITLEGGGGTVDLGRGRDILALSELIEDASGGDGRDTLKFNFEAGNVDIAVDGDEIEFFDRFSGQKMTADGFEKIEFEDGSFTIDELNEAFGEDADPYIQVGGGTQVVTVNNVDPTISVIWDRVVQQAVIETSSPVGPTVAARAYAMLHTAMYDAWSAFDDTALRVTFDLDEDSGKMLGLTGSELEDAKEKAMSFAALTVLRVLFPDMDDLFLEVFEDRLGFDPEDDSDIAEIGIDAAEDLLALRLNDGANFAGGYADTTDYEPENSGPNDIQDISRWTPENVPIDPEDNDVEQRFLTPQWQEVEGFALPEDEDGNTVFDTIRPEAPQPFFTEAYAGSVLNYDAKTITLSADLTIGSNTFMAGMDVPVSKTLIGEVINEEFINQAEEVVTFSAELTDEQKIIAEFWEDGGGTAFPPGTSLAFAQFVSARDNHDTDTDAKLFLIMGNAVNDAGIGTWEAKVFYDYVRPVRAIRDLGELELIGVDGVDQNTGESGFVIQAFGGFNADGTGRGTQTILAENWVTFQLPNGNPSPPFAEYTSGHSAFSASGAAVLRLFTGSDDFGGSVTFAPDSLIFEKGVPEEETTLYWETFDEAADEAGLSRLYGGIHFNEGDVNGRDLGTEVGTAAFELAQKFFDGTATDEDRPFYTPDMGDPLMV
ncbi:MAG: DUF6851 domain-containing protein [Pseudomonadota bacterium]